MTVKQMHIEVSQSTQKISASSTRKLYPPELDWLLNKNAERFVQSKLKPKPNGAGAFEIDQVNMDAVRSLLRTKVLDVRVNADSQYEAVLPGDYAYLLSDDSKVLQLCGAAKPDVIPVTKTVKTIPFGKQTSTAPYYASSTITVGAVTVSLPAINTASQGTYAGYQSADQIFMLPAIFRQHLVEAGVEVYWERYRDIYAPKSLLVITTEIVTANISGSAATIGSQTVTYNTNTDGGSWVPNRLSPTDKVSTLLVTPFSTTTAQSPISKLTGGSLIVYGDDASFIVSRVNVDYIKKQRRIELILGQDCELAEEFHMAVCDLTAEYFEAMVSNPNWEVNLKNNIARSPAI
jgi:hypothetical protein